MKRNFLKKRLELTPVQLIVISYFLATFVAMILFSLPVTLKQGVTLSFVDTLFTSVSAISVTGLSVVSIVDTFSVFGIFMLMIVLQFGAIGLMTLGTFIYVMMGRKIGLTHRRLIMIDQNRGNIKGVVQTIRLVLGFALTIEFVGAIIFGTYFYLSGYETTWYEAYYVGLFHALSSYTNAGFDIFGDSLYRFSQDYFVQTLTMILLILGALGFPVLIEIRTKLAKKYPDFRFSLYTKLTTSIFFILILLGALSFFLLEKDLFMANLPWHEKVFHSLFFSVTPRNGGLATLDVNIFSTPTLFIISILMFIGASPSSVGGGIRTTTFAVVLLSIFTFSKGKSEVRVFKRRLATEDIMKSFVVFSTSIMLVITAIILLDSIEQYSLIGIIFEVCSAFGTTGLSMGFTTELSTPGKYVIIALMFIGRIGILSALLFISGKNNKESYHLPEERVIIG
ncbi:TrkH family potassium uptake protein [Desulfosporosinus sp.]|uniref:TrkH family potassium uptake protein n=1 Tax=Desulfosporosinus sp. TaxID=157907 RepID=UPI0025BFA90F|nr:potassium transporter TrkG [Desulfosporosinus sp.]